MLLTFWRLFKKLPFYPVFISIWRINHITTCRLIDVKFRHMLVGQIGFLNMREFYVLFDVKFYCKLFYPIYYAAKVMYPEFQMPSHKCLSVRKEMKICVFFVPTFWRFYFFCSESLLSLAISGWFWTLMHFLMSPIYSLQIDLQYFTIGKWNMHQIWQFCLKFTSQDFSTITHFKIMKYCIRMPEEIHKKVTK